MNTAASRGAILIVVAAIIGAIILGRGFDSAGSPSSVSAGADDSTDDDTPEVTTNPDDVVIGEEDIDGDGTPEPAIDTDGDGVVDAPAEDTDGDGVVDSPIDDGVPLTPQARTPADVRVIVANGTAINGAAGAASDRLNARGYSMLTPINADNVAATTIYYEPDFEADALLVAEYLSALPTQVAPLPVGGPDPASTDRRGANILVVLGTDEVTQPADGEADAGTDAGTETTG